MGIFEKRNSLSRGELRDSLRRDSGIIPKTGGQKFSQDERENLRNVFGSKYGGEISKDDFKSAVRDMERLKGSSQNPNEKRELERQIDYLKRVGGV